MYRNEMEDILLDAANLDREGNFEKASALYEKVISAEALEKFKGDAYAEEAYIRLADIAGITGDKTKEEGYLNDAAALGSIAAILRTGAQKGSQDAEILRRLEETAADSSDAAFVLGHLYENGLGVTADPEKAVKMYEKSAAYGQLRLGTAYLYGELGLETNEKKALNYLTASAENGCSAAMIELGKLYQYGSAGLQQSAEKAKEYFDAAANAGDYESKDCLDILEQEENERKAREEAERKAEEERQRAIAEKLRKEEEERKAKEEAERKRLEAEEAERRKKEEELRAIEEEKQKAAEMLRLSEEAKKKAEEERIKAEEARKKAEEERIRAEEARKRAAEEAQRKAATPTPPPAPTPAPAKETPLFMRIFIPFFIIVAILFIPVAGIAGAFYALIIAGFWSWVISAIINAKNNKKK